MIRRQVEGVGSGLRKSADSSRRLRVSMGPPTVQEMELEPGISANQDILLLRVIMVVWSAVRVGRGNRNDEMLGSPIE